MGLEYDEIMADVKDLIIKTLIAIQPHILEKIDKSVAFVLSIDLAAITTPFSSSMGLMS